jgi:hypothetical protein
MEQKGENVGGLRERFGGRRRWMGERVGGGDDDQRKKKKKRELVLGMWKRACCVLGM